MGVKLVEMEVFMHKNKGKFNHYVNSKNLKIFKH